MTFSLLIRQKRATAENYGRLLFGRQQFLILRRQFFTKLIFSTDSKAALLFTFYYLIQYTLLVIIDLPISSLSQKYNFSCVSFIGQEYCKSCNLFLITYFLWNKYAHRLNLSFFEIYSEALSLKLPKENIRDGL